MKKLGLLGRYGVVAVAAMGLTVGAASSTAASVAQDPCNCGQYAWYACSYDENGQPIQVTFECYDQKYNECLATCSEAGGLAFNLDYLRDRA